MRRSAAILFLLVIVLNGTLELACVLAPPRAGGVSSAVHAHAGGIEPLAAGCCSSPPAPEPLCACTCCGPVCSMGAHCTCGKPQEPRAPAAGLFFALPTCSPSDLGTASYVPASLGFIFLTPETIPAPRLVTSGYVPAPAVPRLPSGTLPLLTPPPEDRAVVSTA